MVSTICACWLPLILNFAHLTDLLAQRCHHEALATILSELCGICRYHSILTSWISSSRVSRSLLSGQQTDEVVGDFCHYGHQKFRIAFMHTLERS